MSNNRSINLLGASFSTGNLGVSALAWSSIRLIRDQWPHANVEMVGAGWTVSRCPIQFEGKEIVMTGRPIRFCPKFWIADHYIWLIIGVILFRLFPFLRKKWAKRDSTLGALSRADMIADITGGDSFSDIYGFKRFFLGYLTKRLCQITGKPLVMLPQTYGPFNSRITRMMARRVLKRCMRIYSRDQEGLAMINDLIGPNDKTQLCPDVAFALEPRALERSVITNQQLANMLLTPDKSKLVGLNVSGLLYSGGYTGNNEFGLSIDYKGLLKEIIEYFTDLPDTKVLLVPHVVPEGCGVENDLIACHKLQNSLSDSIRKNVFIAEPGDDRSFFDQCEIKYLIGQCDFFLGSRMHATIAAISQCIPTVGLAYSKKFAGVYETAGVEDCVADLRSLANTEVLEKVKRIYQNRNEVRQRLEKSIPEVKAKVYQIFDGF